MLGSFFLHFSLALPGRLNTKCNNHIRAVDALKINLSMLCTPFDYFLSLPLCTQARKASWASLELWWIDDKQHRWHRKGYVFLYLSRLQLLCFKNPSHVDFHLTLDTARPITLKQFCYVTQESVIQK